MMMNDEVLRRFQNSQEFRAFEEDGKKILTGHPAVFNEETKIYYWKEVIEPRAFDEADMSNVFLLVNHDLSQVPLARCRPIDLNSTMTLSVDSKGLSMRAILDTENNAAARNVYSAVQRGDITGMSFMFKVKDEEWENLDDEMPTRHITAISKVHEVSIVTFPAYEATDVNARSKDLSTLNALRMREPSKINEVEQYRQKIQLLGGCKL